MTALSDDVRRLIEGVNYAHLATLLPDGAPHSVPLWVGLEGERISFLTSPRSRKARNIARDPRVALSIADQAQPFTMAIVRGRVVERIDGDRAWTIIDRLSLKYLGQLYPERTDRVVFLIEPEHARAIAYG
jgi:PPOX class probable F420-dependent enzyme